MAPSKQDEARYQVLENKLDAVQDDVREIKEVLRGSYVTQDQFGPVRTIVYGLVGLILLSVVGALLTLVLRS